MRPVTPKRPCPVCEKPDWCLVAPDGSAAIRQRVESTKRVGEAGWLHRLAGPPPRAWRPAAAADDWPAVAARLANRLTPDHRDHLSAGLGVPADAVVALPLIGVSGVGSNGVTYTFPEADAAGVVVGVVERFPGGGKKMMTGGRRGLTLPIGWRDDAVVRRVQDAPVVSDLSRASLREDLTRVAEFYTVRQTDGGAVERVVPPPDFCVSAMWDRKAWPGVPPLQAVVPHPAFLADGRVLAADGYDPGTGLYLHMYLHMSRGLDLSVPESPTREDARKALALLTDVVTDFPFAAPENRAAWVASLLTPVAWFAFAGPAPFFLIDGNCRGAGKVLLADAAGLILTGRRFSVMSYDPDATELRKRITSPAA